MLGGIGSNFYEPTVENGGHRGYRSLNHLIHWDGSAEEALQGGHAFVGDPARDDQAELVEIGRDVERKPVARHPTGDAHPDRGQFLPPRAPFASAVFTHAPVSPGRRVAARPNAAAMRIMTSSRSRT